MLSKSIIQAADRACKRLFAGAVALGLVLGAAPAFGQHVHQLNYNNSNWSDTDLTTLAGGPQPAFVGITGFYTTPNDDLHVFYVANADSHIHQLSYKDYGAPTGWAWEDEDETAITNGVTAVTNTFSAPISGFALGNAQYVYFCGSDNAIHEYSYGDKGNWNWVDRSLSTAIGGAPNCSSLSNGLIAYATPANHQRHVFYQPVATSSDIEHLVLKGTAWYAEDETKTSHGAKGNGDWMAGFAIGTAQYTFFEDTKGNIHQLAYGAGGNWNWVDTNLTAAAKGTKSDTALLAGVSAFRVPGTQKIELYYATSAFDTHQMTFLNSKWTDEDIGGQGPSYGGQMVGFATTPNNQFHVYHESDLGGQFGVYQQYFNGKAWSGQMLSNGLTEGGLTGFAIKNYQYVFYISFD